MQDSLLVKELVNHFSARLTKRPLKKFKAFLNKERRTVCVPVVANAAVVAVIKIKTIINAVHNIWASALG